jgi:hypothetical protein
MRLSNFSMHMLSLFSGVAVLAGCSGGGSTPSSPSLSLGSGGPLSIVTRDVLRLSPDAKGVTPQSMVKRLAKRLPNVYVADAGKNAIYEIVRDRVYGQFLTLGSGFKKPTGVALDRRGDVFVADNGNNAIKEMLAVNGSIPPNPVINTITTSIPNPYGVGVDIHKNIFVTNNSGSVVYEIVAPHYKTINQLGSFSFPTSVAVDALANVYVGTAASTSEVFEMLAPGYTTVQTLGGGNGEFLNPYGLAIDRSGKVYVADYNNSAIKRMPPNCFSNSCVRTLTNQFYRPVGVAVDRSFNVYGTDVATGEVFEIMRAGGYQTIKVLANGFSNPWGIAVR